MEDYSKYDQLYDKESILSGNPNNKTIIESQTYNIISATGLVGI